MAERFKWFIFGLIAGVLLFDSSIIFAKELERQAKVIFAKGEASVQRAGKTEWIDAKEEMFLSDGDTARTGKNSVIEMIFDKDNKNIARLEENSTAILRGKALRQIELPAGKIRFVIKSLKKDSSFEIKTPTVIAGARGSGGDVIVGDNADTIKAFEDELFVQSFDEQGNMIQEISLREGWEVLVERFQAPSELVELTETDRADWGSWREDFGERMETERIYEEESVAPAEFAPVESIQQETMDKQEEYKQEVIQQLDTQNIEKAKEEEEKAASSDNEGYGQSGGY